MNEDRTNVDHDKSMVPSVGMKVFLSGAMLFMISVSLYVWGPTDVASTAVSSAPPEQESVAPPQPEAEDSKPQGIAAGTAATPTMTGTNTPIQPAATAKGTASEPSTPKKTVDTTSPAKRTSEETAAKKSTTTAAVKSRVTTEPAASAPVKPQLKQEPLADKVPVKPRTEEEPLTDKAPAKPRTEQEPLADKVPVKPWTDEEPIAERASTRPEPAQEPPAWLNYNQPSQAPREDDCPTWLKCVKSHK
ncbi:hypothetical protein [Heliophilum fasciatum]|uniref:hypothetical protein n=1 Tax=Heliophilum fasciatum TaxID=35700 RepID=UPI0010513F4E|nr:hypothetical protein [Heliophilum fasciatum]